MEFPPEVFGKIIWNFFHSVGAFADTDEKFDAAIITIENGIDYLPCGTCRDNTITFYKEHHPEQYRHIVNAEGTKVGMFIFTVDLHNHANRITGAAQVKWTDVYDFYRKPRPSLFPRTQFKRAEVPPPKAPTRMTPTSVVPQRTVPQRVPSQSVTVMKQPVTIVKQPVVKQSSVTPTRSVPGVVVRQPTMPQRQMPPIAKVQSVATKQPVVVSNQVIRPNNHRVVTPLQHQSVRVEGVALPAAKECPCKKKK